MIAILFFIVLTALIVKALAETVWGFALIVIGLVLGIVGYLITFGIWAYHLVIPRKPRRTPLGLLLKRQWA